jgi:ElaB/YqjD/DUF883 family membrane-anchored ribosome-binding protein
MAHAAGAHTVGSDNKMIKEKAGDVVDAAVELGGAAKKYATHRIGDVKERAAGMLGAAKEKISDANEVVVDYVQTNPFKAIAIAAGIGFLAGYILKRR